MAYSAIRDYLKAKLEAIGSVGTVHDYYRFLRKQKNIEPVLYEGGILNAWFIRKIGETNAWPGNGMLERVHLIHLVGVMAINDEIASEKVFLGITNDIIAALTIDFTWGGLCYQTKVPFLKKHDIRNFANVLCHHATIEIQPTELSSV